jgi:hypothetical protein
MKEVMRVTLPEKGREMRRVPRAFAKRITRVGGRNRYDEPMYRVVWGQDRMTWVGMQWEPKYGDHLWHLEKWVDSDFYGDRETWERTAVQTTYDGRMDILGPFPYRGDYEEVSSFAPVELSQTYADFLVGVIETSRHYGSSQRREALEKREAKKQSSWDRYADDVLDDAFPAFHGVPHVSQAKGVSR